MTSNHKKSKIKYSLKYTVILDHIEMQFGPKNMQNHTLYNDKITITYHLNSNPIFSMESILAKFHYQKQSHALPIRTDVDETSVCYVIAIS